MMNKRGVKLVMVHGWTKKSVVKMDERRILVSVVREEGEGRERLQDLA